eukprot:1151855-Pelagomonas_calceolata.AAC.2
MEPAHCGIEDSPIPYTGTPWDLHGLRLLVHSEWHVWKQRRPLVKTTDSWPALSMKELHKEKDTYGHEGKIGPHCAQCVWANPGLEDDMQRVVSSKQDVGT